MADQPPTFTEVMDRAVLSNDQRIELAIVYAYDPILAGVKIGSIILAQNVAMAIAADSDSL